MDAGDFQIHLRTFTGPFDLLLHLAKRSEVDLLEVPIAGIAHQFLEHLRALRTLDFELAGEFLVVAATLMEIKSRLMLPVSPQTSRGAAVEPEETGLSLVAQLIEYRRYKRAAGRLEELADGQARHRPRMADEGSEAADPTALHRVEIWDLLSVFAKLVRDAAEGDGRQTIIDDTPQTTYEAEIIALLREESPRDFESLFIAPRTRLRLIGSFLAVLELVKKQRVRVDFAGGCRLVAELVPDAFDGVVPALKLADTPLD